MIEHVYVSTACLHGLCGVCGTAQRDRDEPGPPHCKFCTAVCACPLPTCDHAPPARLQHTTPPRPRHIRRPGGAP